MKNSSSSPDRNIVAALSNDAFWDLLLEFFCDEEKVEEFSQISKIPVEQITAARTKYLRRKTDEIMAHYHRASTTIN
jgi:hypothetical protein